MKFRLAAAVLTIFATANIARADVPAVPSLDTVASGGIAFIVAGVAVCAGLVIGGVILAMRLGRSNGVDAADAGGGDKSADSPDNDGGGIGE